MTAFQVAVKFFIPKEVLERNWNAVGVRLGEF